MLRVQTRQYTALSYSRSYTIFQNTVETGFGFE